MAPAGERPRYRPRARKSRPGTWTDERIVAALRDWYERFGETPLSPEWSPRGAELAGLEAPRRGEWLRHYPRWPSTATVCRHFGSWSAALRAAELPPARAIAGSRDVAARVEAARRLRADGHGVAEIAALLGVAPRTVRGYWRGGVCHDCGAPTVTSDRCRACAARHASPPHWERGEVIAAIRAWVREKGAAPTSEDWAPGDPDSVWARESPRWPSSVTVRTLFGSWRGGVAAAGLCHEVRIAAAPETVFRYFTDPERMTRWLGAAALLDPRPGGVCRIAFDDRTAVSGEFVEVEPPRRIELRLGWEESAPTTAVEVSLRRDGEGTLVQVAQRRLES